jgi:O-antigen/teichoic acid export membrane protein
MKAFVVVDQVLDWGVRVLLVSAVFVAGLGLQEVALAVTVSAWVTGAVALFAARGLVGRPALNLPGGTRVVARYAGFQWGSQAATFGLLWADTLLLGVWRRPSEVAVYSVATRTILIGAAVVAAVGVAVQPSLGRLFAQGELEGLRRAYSSSTCLSALAGIPVFLLTAYLASDLLTVAYGPAYAVGAGALVALAIGQTVAAVTGPCGYLVGMIGRTDLLFQNMVAVLILNVVLNVVLIPEWGMVGAGVAWGTAVTVANGLRSLQVWLLIEMHPFGAWCWRMLIPLGCGAVGAWVGTYLVQGPPAVAVLVSSALGAACYGLALGRDRSLSRLSLPTGA